MSDESIDNYDKEFVLLKRLVEQPSFKFIVVRYNHYDLVNRLKHDLTRLFPDRTLKSLETSKTDYREFMDTWESLESGFLLMEHFEDVLLSERAIDTKEEDDTKEDKRRRGLTSGMNLRRDKIAEKPNVLIMLIASTVDEDSARNLMSRIPDLWSLRSLFIDIKKPWQYYRLKTFTNEEELHPNEIAQDVIEIERLKKKLQSTPKEEHNLRLSIYPKLTRLLLKVKQGEEAIKVLNNWSEIEQDERIDLFKGEAFLILGEAGKAVQYFARSGRQFRENSKSSQLFHKLLLTYAEYQDTKLVEELIEKILAENESESDFSNIQFNKYLFAGNVFTQVEDLTTAEEYYKKALTYIADIKFSHPDTVAILLFNYGELLLEKGEYDEALKQFDRVTNQFSSDNKNWVLINARSRYYIGHILLHKGEIDLGINSYQKGIEIYQSLEGKYDRQISYGYSLIGWALGLKEDLEQANDYFEKSFNLNQEAFTDFLSSLIKDDQINPVVLDQLKERGIDEPNNFIHNLINSIRHKENLT